MYKRNIDQGFTLIELMITVAIVGILAAITYPSYTSFVMRSDRAEAQRELVRLANLQEQLYTDSRVYTQNMKELGMPEDPYTTESKNYQIDAKINGATFILTAKAQGSQAKDTACKELTINEAGLKTPAGSCWEQ
ncbi:type IV pilin protein [Thalassotalea piscium]